MPESDFPFCSKEWMDKTAEAIVEAEHNRCNMVADMMAKYRISAAYDPERVEQCVTDANGYVLSLHYDWRPRCRLGFCPVGLDIQVKYEDGSVYRTKMNDKGYFIGVPLTRSAEEPIWWRFIEPDQGDDG